MMNTAGCPIPPNEPIRIRPGLYKPIRFWIRAGTGIRCPGSIGLPYVYTHCGGLVHMLMVKQENRKALRT